MKKLLLLLFLIPNLAFSLPETLNQYISKNPNWSSTDKESLSYIASRCGILFKAISESYNNIAAQEIYNMSVMNAENFSKASSDIYKTRCINFACIKVKKKASQEREKKWLFIYGEELRNNINIYGEMFHGDMKSDILICTSKVKPILK